MPLPPGDTSDDDRGRAGRSAATVRTGDRSASSGAPSSSSSRVLEPLPGAQALGGAGARGRDRSARRRHRRRGARDRRRRRARHRRRALRRASPSMRVVALRSVSANDRLGPRSRSLQMNRLIPVPDREQSLQHTLLARPAVGHRRHRVYCSSHDDNRPRRTRRARRAPRAAARRLRASQLAAELSLTPLA